MNDAARDAVRRMAADYNAAGDPAGWFEPLYKNAAGDSTTIPWANLKPNHNLTDWLDANPVASGSNALVVGCGLGDDAEELSRRGMNVTAFDIAPSAIAWCRQRFPDSKVRYEAGDLLALPDAWRAQFDLVVEIYTLQTMSDELRRRAMQGLAGTLASEGKLLIVCRGREPEDPKGELPWPLTRAEFDPLRALLDERPFEDYIDKQDEPVRRFRAVYQRR